MSNNIEHDNENRLLPNIYIDDSVFQELYYQLRMRLKGSRN